MPIPERIDLGCGYHVPLRWSQLCILYRYDRDVRSSCYVGEKVFPAPIVVQSLEGRWDFHSKDGRNQIASSRVLVGTPGQGFGCRHDVSTPSTAYVAYLQPGAVDEDEKPLFDKQVLPAAHLPSLKRSLAFEDPDAFDSFVFEVFRSASEVSLGTVRQEKRANVRVQRVKRFIEHHAFEDITLLDVAASVNVSPFVCIREFKRATGMTPHAYISSIRLDAAKRLLANRRLTVGDVARRVGIRDRFYFTRWFAKEAGIPPQTFRLEVS